MFDGVRSPYSEWALADRGAWAAFLVSVSLRGGMNALRLLRPTPTLQEPRQTCPLQAGARSTRRGLGVGVVNSLGGSFVWGPSTVVDRSFRYTAKA